MLSYLRKIGTNTLYYGLGQVSTLAIGFLLIPVYTRVLTPEEYGIVSLILTVTSIFSIFCDMGLGGALGVFYFDYYRNDRKLKTYISSILLFLLPYGTSLVIIAALFGKPLFQPLLKGVSFSPFILIAFIVGFCQVFFRYLQTFLQVEGKAALYASISFFSFFINVTLIIFFVVYLKEGVLGNSKADLITAISFFAIALFILRKYFILKTDFKILRESLKFGMPLIPHLLSGWIMKAVDRLFINQYSGLVQLGVYTLGFQLGSVMSIFTNSFNAAWAPFFMATAKEQGEDAKPTVARLTTYYLATIFFLGVFISLPAREIISFVASADYGSSYQVVPIIVTGYVISGMYYMVVNQLFYTKKTKYLPLATFSGGFLQIILNYLMVPHYGMMGAAWAMLITNLWTFLLTWFISSRVYPMRFEYGRIFRIILVSSLILGAGLNIHFSSLWYGLATKILLLMVYPVFLFLIGFFQHDELCKAKTWIEYIFQRYWQGHKIKDQG